MALILEQSHRKSGGYPRDEEIAAIRLAVAKRRQFDFWFAVGVLTVSIIVATIGMLTRADLLAFLADWRPGVLLLVGIAFLFTNTILLQLSLQQRASLEDLEELQRSNAELAEHIRRRLAAERHTVG